jgi:DNA-binding NarL/FixJ family response regulator
VSAAIRVVLADDHQLVRAGFRVILSTEEDLEVVGEAGDGREAVALVTATNPDVVLMDVQMPGMDGIEATGLITSTTDSRVIVLTTFDNDGYLFTALRAGASGFLLKNARAEELVDAVRLVAAGDALLSPSVTARVIERATRSSSDDSPADARLDALTDRESEVLVLLGRGASNTEIATGLFVSETTVKTHVSRILLKLGLRDRTAAVVFAYENGIITPGSGTPPA